MNLFQQIPSVDKLLSFFPNYDNKGYLKKVINRELDNIREEIIAGQRQNIELTEIVADISRMLALPKYNLKKVINATGTILHTNLGRSVLSLKSVQNLVEVATNYNNLEYNLNNFQRGSRYDHIKSIICELTGAEDMLVVNNNAAAVLLTLTSLVTNSEVIISRGELVEIGGSFRVPEIMNYSNTTLNEVGTTNKTHLFDYEKAISDKTAAILKVHTSNYKIIGFTSDVGIEQLANIAKKNNLLLIEDIGSGTLVDLNKYTHLNEPTVQNSLAKGADIVTFSGDKLLGSAQAGFIVGKKSLIDKMKKNNLLRSLRVDKLTLSVIEATLDSYLDESSLHEIPTMRMITEDVSETKKRAYKLSSLLTIEHEIIETKATIGGGSLPNEYLKSYAIALSVNNLENTFKMLHDNKIPIITRISNNKLIIDVKTIFEEDFAYLSEVLNCQI